MPWKLIHLEAEGVVETVYEGALTFSELEEAIRANAAARAEHGIRWFLADCRGLSAGGSLTDVYRLPALFERLGLGRDWKEAILLPAMPAAEDEMRFYETVTLNQGYQVRIFASREEALAWLVASREAAPEGE
jgi:hypothetical protein